MLGYFFFSKEESAGDPAWRFLVGNTSSSLVHLFVSGVFLLAFFQLFLSILFVQTPEEYTAVNKMQVLEHNSYIEQLSSLLDLVNVSALCFVEQ